MYEMNLMLLSKKLLEVSAEKVGGGSKNISSNKINMFALK